MSFYSPRLAFACAFFFCCPAVAQDDLNSIISAEQFILPLGQVPPMMGPLPLPLPGRSAFPDSTRGAPRDNRPWLFMQEAPPRG